MKTKTKLFIGLLSLSLIVCGGLWKLYNDNYGGNIYYTQILVTPEKENEKDSKSNNWSVYNYDQNVYSETKETKIVHMREHRNSPLRLNAYLKLLVNDKKGVLTWEEVEKSEIPQKVLEQMKTETSN